MLHFTRVAGCTSACLLMLATLPAFVFAQPTGVQLETHQKRARTAPAPFSLRPATTAPQIERAGGSPQSPIVRNPVTPAAYEAPIQLTPPSDAVGKVPSRQVKGATGGMLTTAFGSLAIVLSLFFLVLWVMRRAAPSGTAVLPTEVIELLGRAPLNARQQMQLIRLGNRLLLLSVTAQGAETLAEITDQSEVDRLAGLCQQQRAGSVSETFRQVLTQFSSEPAQAGFVGDSSGRLAGRGQSE